MYTTDSELFFFPMGLSKPGLMRRLVSKTVVGHMLLIVLEREREREYEDIMDTEVLTV